MATPNSNSKLNIANLIWPIVYMAALIVLPILRNVFAHSLPHYILYPLDNMPLSVLWFGALGGLLLSLYHLFVNRDWQSPFNLWHVFSGLLGAVYGLISYLIVIVIINSTTISNNFNHNSLAYDLIAFLFGFSQMAFQGLLRRVTGLIFGAGRDEA